MKYITILHFNLKQEAEGQSIGSVKIEVEGPRVSKDKKDFLHEKLTEVFEGVWVERQSLEGSRTKRKI